MKKFLLVLFVAAIGIMTVSFTNANQAKEELPFLTCTYVEGGDINIYQTTDFSVGWHVGPGSNPCSTCYNWTVTGAAIKWDVSNTRSITLYGNSPGEFSLTCQYTTTGGQHYSCTYNGVVQ